MASDFVGMSNFEVFMLLNKRYLDRDIAEAYDDIDALMDEWNKRKRAIARGINEIGSIINTGLSVWRNAIVAAGGTLEPIQEAALSFIMGTIVTMQSIATAYATMGPLGWGAAVIVGAASITLNAIAQAQMVAEMDEARRQFSAATAAMEGSLSLIRQVGGMF